MEGKWENTFTLLKFENLSAFINECNSYLEQLRKCRFVVCPGLKTLYRQFQANFSEFIFCLYNNYS